MFPFRIHNLATKALIIIVISLHVYMCFVKYKKKYRCVVIVPLPPLPSPRQPKHTIIVVVLTCCSSILFYKFVIFLLRNEINIKYPP